GEVPPGADAEMHERVLGPLLEAGAVPEVALADPGSAEDGTRTATLSWSWALPDDAGTWEYTTQATLRRGEDGWAPDLDPRPTRPTSQRPSTSRSPRSTRSSAASPTATAPCCSATCP